MTSSSGGTQTVPFGGGGGGGTTEAEGTGFVIDTAGHIVTNEHVVQGASSMTVRFDDQSTYKAKVVGSDESTDLAVIKVNRPRASSTRSRSVTRAPSGRRRRDRDRRPVRARRHRDSGIVSAVGREITSPNNMPIENAIQTDAAINHGNSGGPLLNLNGKVIGVTAQIQSQGGGNEGIGFAIPSTTVKSVTSQLISTGSVKHALLGVEDAAIRASLAGTIGDAAGVAVTTVESSTAASSAGLKARPAP